MRTELKKAIIDYIFENARLFSLENNVTEKFRLYVYDGDGEYLIGGRQVAEFIKQAIVLITND